MLFRLKNRPFVSATFHRSRRGFAPEANVEASLKWPTSVLDVETNNKNKSSQRILAGSRKCVRSVFIWEQDSALKWLCFRVISCEINEGIALKCSLLPLSTLFHGIYYGNIERLMILLIYSAKNPLSTF